MSVGEHLPNSLLSYLLDGEGQNNLTSHVENTRTLKLKTFKENVVSKEEHARRSWTNASFFVFVRPYGKQILGM
jgi:hypothetical protein